VLCVARMYRTAHGCNIPGMAWLKMSSWVKYFLPLTQTVSLLADKISVVLWLWQVWSLPANDACA